MKTPKSALEELEKRLNAILVDLPRAKVSAETLKYGIR